MKESFLSIMEIAVYVFNPSHIFLMAKSLLIDTPDTGVKQRPIAIIQANTRCGFKYFRTRTHGIKLFRTARSFESNGSSDVKATEIFDTVPIQASIANVPERLGFPTQDDG